MLVGLLSDTHDNIAATSAAVRALLDRGAEFLVHCGDLGSQRVLDYMAGVPSAFVWGNCDWDRPALVRYAQQLGIACYGPMGVLELGSKRAALLHGDDHRLKRAVLENQTEDYLFMGHTHAKEDQRVGRVRVVNPGALHRTRDKSVALVETESDRVEFVSVKAEQP